MGTATIADVFNAASGAANTAANILGGLKKEKDDLYIRNALLDLENMGDAYLLELEQSNASTAAGNEYEGYADGWKKQLAQWQNKHGNTDAYTRERLTLAAREMDNGMKTRLGKAAWEKDKNHMAATYGETKQQAAIRYADNPGAFIAIISESAGNLFRAGVFNETQYAEELAQIPLTAMSLAGKTVTDRFLAAGGGSEQALVDMLDRAFTEDFFRAVETATEHWGREVTGEGERRQKLMSVDLRAYRDTVVGNARAAWKQAARERETENINGIYETVNGWLAGKEQPAPGRIQDLVNTVMGFDEFNMGEETKNRFIRMLRGFEEDPEEGRAARLGLIKDMIQDETGLANFVKELYQGDYDDMTLTEGLDLYTDIVFDRVKSLGEYQGETGRQDFEYDYALTISGKYMAEVKKQTPPELKNTVDILDRYINGLYTDALKPDKDGKEKDNAESDRRAASAAMVFIEDLWLNGNIAYYANHPQEFEKRVKDFIGGETVKLLEKQNYRNARDRIEAEQLIASGTAEDLIVTNQNGVEHWQSDAAREQITALRNAQRGLLAARLGIDEEQIEIQSEATQRGSDVGPRAVFKTPQGLFRVDYDPETRLESYYKQNGKTWERVDRLEPEPEQRLNLEDYKKIGNGYRQDTEKPLTVDQETSQGVLENIKAEKDETRRKQMIEHAVRYRVITPEDAEKLGYKR